VTSSAAATWLRRHPCLADDPADQRQGFRVRQTGQAQPASAVAYDQTGQPGTAGHQHETAGGAGQQRFDLLGVARVVQQQQHALAVHDAAEQRGAGTDIRRNGVRGDTQGQQESGEHVGRVRRYAGRVIAAQIREQRAVREPAAQFVRPMQRERGFPDPAETFDQRDQHPARRPAGEHRVELADLPATTGEIRDRGGQLCRAVGRFATGGHPTGPRTGLGRVRVRSRDQQAQQATFRTQCLVAAPGKLHSRWLVPGFDLAQVALAVMDERRKIGEGKAALRAQGAQAFPEGRGRYAGFADGLRFVHLTRPPLSANAGSPNLGQPLKASPVNARSPYPYGSGAEGSKGSNAGREYRTYLRVCIHTIAQRYQ